MRKTTLVSLSVGVLLLVGAPTFISTASTKFPPTPGARNVYDLGEVSLTEIVDENGAYTMGVDRAAMSYLRDLLAKDEKVAITLYDKILIASGLSERTVNQRSLERKIWEINSYVEISSSTAYIGIDASGNMIVLSREECLNQVKK